MMEKTGNREGVIGKPITLIPLILAVFFLMMAFVALSAIVAKSKEKENSISEDDYEVDMNSLLFRKIIINGDKKILLDALISESESNRNGYGEFSESFRSGLKKMMEEDLNYMGRDSCVFIRTILFSDKGSVSLDLKNSFVKDKEGKASENKQFQLKISENSRLIDSVSLVNIKLDKSLLDIESYYGGCGR